MSAYYVPSIEHARVLVSVQGLPRDLPPPIAESLIIHLLKQIADLARKLRKEKRERERLENLGISGPVPDSPPPLDEAAVAATLKNVATAPRKKSSTAAATTAKRPGAGYQSAYRVVSQSASPPL